MCVNASMRGLVGALMLCQIMIVDTGAQMLTSNADADGGRRILEVVESAAHAGEG